MVSVLMVELFHMKASLGLGGSARMDWLALRSAPPVVSGGQSDCEARGNFDRQGHLRGRTHRTPPGKQPHGEEEKTQDPSQLSFRNWLRVKRGPHPGDAPMDAYDFSLTAYVEVLPYVLRRTIIITPTIPANNMRPYGIRLIRFVRDIFI